MSLPSNKVVTEKFDGNPLKRSLVPFTQEDAEQTINLPLTAVLRGHTDYSKWIP